MRVQILLVGIFREVFLQYFFEVGVDFWVQVLQVRHVRLLDEFDCLVVGFFEE